MFAKSKAFFQEAKHLGEIADLLEADYYVLGTTGREAILQMMSDIATLFQTTPEEEIDWLTRSDGSRSTLPDVVRAIDALAAQFERDGVMDKRIL